MNLLKQSSTAQPLLFLLVSSSDHVSPATGKTPAVYLSKNGGAFVAASGAVSEIGNGWYKLAGNATDTGTLGPLVLHAEASGADPTDTKFQVVAYDPNAANLGMVLAKGTDITGFNDITTGAIRTELSTELARIDVNTSSRNATAPDNSGIAAIKAKTDNLPASPAAVGSAMSLEAGTTVTLAASQPNYAPAKAGDAMALASGTKVVLAASQTDYAPAKAGDAMTLAANQDVRHVTGTVNGMVAPDNTTIGLIHAKTQNLPASPAAVGSPMTLDSAVRVLLAASQPDYVPAKAGDAMALTSAAQTALVAALEVELVDDMTGEAFMAAIADKLAAEFDIENVTVAAIVNGVRDEMLNRVLSGNYTVPGSLGVLLQALPAVGTVNTVAPDNATISTILGYVQNLPVAPAAAGDIPSAGEVAEAVRTELATELARVDASISSRNATAPDNASIAAIKAKTDALPASPADQSTVTAIKSKTDALPASPAAVGSPMTLAANQDVRNVTGTVAGMVAPANADILAAIEGVAGSVAGIPTTEPATPMDVATVVSAVAAVKGVVDGVDTKLDALDSLATLGTLDARTQAIKSKTDLIPANPAVAGAEVVLTEGSRSAVATAVWAVGNRTITGAQGLATDLLETQIGEPIPGSVGDALAKAANASEAQDPWAAMNILEYPAGSAGAMLARLHLPDSTDPVVFIPGPPTDVGMCRVYGYLEDVGGAPARNVKISFSLYRVGPVKSERLVAGTKITVSSDNDGRVLFDLQRNDLMTPQGSYYHVTCEAIGMVNRKMTLSTETFNLAELVS